MKNREAVRQQGDVIWNIAHRQQLKAAGKHDDLTIKKMGKLNKGKVGGESPCNRHFHARTPPRPLAEIAQDFERLERDTLALLKEIAA